MKYVFIATDVNKKDSPQAHLKTSGALDVLQLMTKWFWLHCFNQPISFTSFVWIFFRNLFLKNNMMLRKETLNNVYIGDGISYICRFKRLCNEKIEQYFARVIFVVVKINFREHIWGVTFDCCQPCWRKIRTVKTNVLNRIVECFSSRVQNCHE